MNHASLFTGIGGFDYAAEVVGIKNVFQVEIDNFCTKVLEKNFPNVQRYRDIKMFDGRKYRGTIDIISGGFPCQPYSNAGQRRGKEDDRALWSEMFRVVKEVRPPFVVCENVTGIISMELDDVLFDLESEGYKTETFLLPAISIGAPHIRNRIWIIAYTNSSSTKDKIQTRGKKLRTCIDGFTNTFSWGFKERLQHFHFRTSKNTNTRTWTDNWFEVATELCGVDDGLPVRMDGYKLTKAQHRSKRLSGLGNSIVPQIAIVLFESIKKIELLR